MVCPPRVAARLARFCLDDDGGAPYPRPQDRYRLCGLRHRHARHRLFGRRWLRHRAGRPAAVDRHHGFASAVVAIDDLAGDGIDDAGLLCARRSRSHSGFSGRRRAALRCPYWHRSAIGRRDGAAARRAVHQHARLARWSALARRLWRHPRHGRDGRGLRGARHRRYISSDWSETHALRRADYRCRHRCCLRHRPAGRGHPLLRDLVAVERAAVRCAAGARAGREQRAVVAGARRARRCSRAHCLARAGIRRACRGHLDCRAALWRLRGRGSQRRCRTVGACAPSERFAGRFTAACTAPQGMDSVAPRSLAGFADADADALSLAAGADAVAEFCRAISRRRASIFSCLYWSWRRASLQAGSPG